VLRFVVGLLLVLGLGACYLVAVAVLPRWWAERVGQASAGRFSNGVVIGFLVGAVFTALALLVLGLVFRRRRSWRTRAALVILALLLCVPNLLTLGIVLGGGGAASAGEGTLDREAPGFRGATLVGVVAGVVFMVFIWSLLASRRKRTREVARLKAQLAERDAASAAPPSPTPLAPSERRASD